jgi:hypothetical protein
VISSLIGVLIGGFFALNTYGQASDAILSRELALENALRGAGELPKLQQRVAEIEAEYNRVLQGDRSVCPQPDDPTSSDCFVGIQLRLDAARRSERLAGGGEVAVATAQDVQLAQSDLDSFKLYAAIVAGLTGLIVGAIALALSLFVAWGYWRNRSIAKRVMIGSLVSVGIGITVGLVVGFLDFTSPDVEGYSCQARSAAGVDESCARDAVLHGERVGFLIALVGIAITFTVVFAIKRRRSAQPRPQSGATA